MYGSISFTAFVVAAAAITAATGTGISSARTNREISERATDSDLLRDALAWMVELWECTETTICKDGNVEEEEEVFYTRLVCSSENNNNGGLEIGLFGDDRCTVGLPGPDDPAELLLSRCDVGQSTNNDAVYFYGVLSEVGLLSRQQNGTETIEELSLQDPESSTDLRAALEWMRSYWDCKWIDYYTHPVLHTQLMCNAEGAGLEIGFFRDENCALYTPEYNFTQFLSHKGFPNRTHYTTLSEAGLIVTNENAKAEFEAAVWWMIDLWDCADTNTTLDGHPIYSQLRCKADGSGPEIALFSDDHCTLRVPGLVFHDILSCQGTKITAHYHQISRYPYLLAEYEALGCSTWLSEIDSPKNERDARRVRQELYMRALIRKTKMSVTIEDPRVNIFLFPRHNGKPNDKRFAEISDDDSQDNEDSFNEWLFPGVDYNDQMVSLFDDMGDRTIMESYLRRNWDGIANDFKPIPQTATWSIQRVEGDLIPILQDENFIYLLSPTSAEAASRIGEISMPTPYQARVPIDGISPGFFTMDIWMEDCGDGGVYVLGLDDKVLLYYVDSPFNLVMNRFQCDRKQWERMWISAFGETTVRIDDVETVDDLIAAYKNADDGPESDEECSTITGKSIHCSGVNYDGIADSSKADSSKANSSKDDCNKADTSEPDTSKADTSKAGSSRAGSSKVDSWTFTLFLNLLTTTFVSYGQLAAHQDKPPN